MPWPDRGIIFKAGLWGYGRGRPYWGLGGQHMTVCSSLLYPLAPQPPSRIPLRQPPELPREDEMLLLASVLTDPFTSMTTQQIQDTNDGLMLGQRRKLKWRMKELKKMTPTFYGLTVIDTIIHVGTNFKGKLNTGNGRLFNNKK